MIEQRFEGFTVRSVQIPAGSEQLIDTRRCDYLSVIAARHPRGVATKRQILYRCLPSTGHLIAGALCAMWALGATGSIYPLLAMIIFILLLIAHPIDA